MGELDGVLGSAAFLRDGAAVHRGVVLVQSDIYEIVNFLLSDGSVRV